MSRVSVSLERIVAFLVVLHPASSALCLALEVGGTGCTGKMWRRGCGRMRRVSERITLPLNHIYVPSLYPSSPDSTPPLSPCLPACEATWNESVARRIKLFADSKLLHERTIECRSVEISDISSTEALREHGREFGFTKGSYFRIRLYILINKEEIVCREINVLSHVELHAYLLLVMLKESLSVSRDQDFSI